MKTISILQYDHDEHTFYPSFVIEDDYQDSDNECAFDELIIQPSEEWMADYLVWNRFGRLPDDPDDDYLDEDDDPTSCAIPVFNSLQEIHEFNAQGHDLAQRLQAQLVQSCANSNCAIQVAPFRPLYSNMLVGPLASWWHVKDCNYGFVVPVQRIPVSDQLKGRLQAFRCHKGLEFWQSNDTATTETMQHFQLERQELQDDLLRELHAEHSNPLSSQDSSASTAKDVAVSVDRVDSLASLGALMEQSCSLVSPPVERGNWFPAHAQRVA